MFKEYLINESSEFSKMEDNPMIYTLVIPRLLACSDIKLVKEDKVLKNVVDVTEKFLKTLPTSTLKRLKEEFKPYAIMDMFKLSKNHVATFDKYYAEFKSNICINESNFIKCMELDRLFSELMNSPEFIAFRNTI